MFWVVDHSSPISVSKVLQRQCMYYSYLVGQNIFSWNPIPLKSTTSLPQISAGCSFSSCQSRHKGTTKTPQVQLFLFTHLELGKQPNIVRQNKHSSDFFHLYSIVLVIIMLRKFWEKLMKIVLQECPQISQVTGTWPFKHSIRRYFCLLHCSTKILFFDNQPCKSRVDDGEIVVQSFMQVITKITATLTTWLKKKWFLSFLHTSQKGKHSIALFVSFNVENLLSSSCT